VTLTTCRRAAGVAWSDVIFAEANAGVWPKRREPSVWIGDDERRGLDKSAGRFSLGMPTSDDRAELERRLYCAIARDTRRRVIFSAALFSEDEPEVRLSPNAWLERVMWGKGAPGAGRLDRHLAAPARPRRAFRRIFPGRSERDPGDPALFGKADRRRRDGSG
jgi:hypothetical protein